jgi:hypothetical protein
VTSGIYQDKSDAMRDARGPMRNRYLGLRVIEEVFDPERDRFVTRTIYRDTSRITQETNVNQGGGEMAMAGAGSVAMASGFSSVDNTMKSVVLGLISISSFLVVGIFGLVWFGLV